MDALQKYCRDRYTQEHKAACKRIKELDKQIAKNLEKKQRG